MNKKEITEVGRIIKHMLKPLKRVPFRTVIKTLSGCEVIPFNKKEKKDSALLKNLSKAVYLAGVNFNNASIKAIRVNEVGNKIEGFVKEALKEVGYKSYTPKTKSGMGKATGYPDIEFIDKYNRVNYLECKTFNIKNISTTQRTFYLSPSSDFKITKNAHHFIAAFEITTIPNKRGISVFECKGWKILSIDNLELDVKYEFNASNARLYTNGSIIAGGKI